MTLTPMVRFTAHSASASHKAPVGMNNNMYSTIHAQLQQFLSASKPASSLTQSATTATPRVAASRV